jgi:hypothetical protein
MIKELEDLDILQSLLHQFLLLDGAVKLSGMDEVKLFFEHPWLVGVID